jgi:hypothetical protein
MVLALMVSGLMATAATSSPSYNASGSFSLGIRGFVPVICRALVDASNVKPKKGIVEVGKLNEFCNSPNGYQVWADYTPSLAEASLVVDGKEVALSDAGSTQLLATTHAGMAQRDLAIKLPSDAVAGSISIRIVAL